MADVGTILRDPDFAALPDAEQRKVLGQLDPDFTALPAPEQDAVLTRLQNPPKAEPSKTPDMSMSDRVKAAGDYLVQRGAQAVESGQNLLADVAQTVTGRPMFPEPRTNWQRGLDVLTVGGTAAAPFVAPELVGAGLAMGAASRAAGTSQETAESLDALTNLVGGGYQMAQAGRAALAAGAIGEAGEAAHLTRGAAASAGAGGITEAARTAQGVTGNLGAALSEAGQAAQTVRGAAAAESAAGISDAAATAEAAKRIEALATRTPVQAGTALRETYPPAEAARRAAFQEGTYDKIAQYAAARGLDATAENAVGQRLGQSLLDAEDTWGDLAGTAEHKQVRTILDRLSTPGAAGRVSWADLDKAEKALQRVKGPSAVRAAIAEAKGGLLAGTPAAKAPESANQQWRLTIRPAKAIAQKITSAESPAQAFSRVMGTGKDPQRMEFTRTILEAHHPEQWTELVGGFFSDLVQKAKGDPVRAAKLWQTVRPAIRAQVDPAGTAATAFEDITAAGSRARSAVPELPTIGPRGLPTPSEVPPVSLPPTALRSLPRAAPVSQAAAPNRLLEAWQYTSRGGGGLEGIRRFYHGDWWGGLMAFGLGTALARPDLAAVAARGALTSPAAARTAVALAANPVVRDVVSGQ